MVSSLLHTSTLPGELQQPHTQCEDVTAPAAFLLDAPVLPGMEGGPVVGPSTSACCHSLGEREGVGLHVHRQELHQWPDGSQHQKREGSTPAITLASGSQLPQQQQEHQQQQKQPQEAWGHEVLAPLGILALPLSRSRDNVQVTLSAPCPVLCLNCMQNWVNRALPLFIEQRQCSGDSLSTLSSALFELHAKLGQTGSAAVEEQRQCSGDSLSTLSSALFELHAKLGQPGSAAVVE